MTIFEYFMIYVTVIFETLRLIKLSRIAFPGIFVIVCLLIILLLLPKQTIFDKKKLAKQRKYKNGQKDNPTFYVTLC